MAWSFAVLCDRHRKKYFVVKFFYGRQAQGYSDERTNNHAGKRNFLLKPC